MGGVGLEIISSIWNLSLPLELIGFLLAWGEIRNHAWIKKLEDRIDAIEKFNPFKNLGTVLLISDVLIVPGIYAMGFLIGLRVVYGGLIEVYIAATLIVISLPFLIKGFNIFSKGNALGSIGILIASTGLLIEISQVIYVRV